MKETPNMKTEQLRRLLTAYSRQYFLGLMQKRHHNRYCAICREFGQRMRDEL